MLIVHHDIQDSTLRQIVDAAQDAAMHHLQSKHNAAYCYHNLAHTERVVQSALLLAEAACLNEEDRAQVIVAAWFHDTGYYDQIDQHESFSAEYARDFLESMNVQPAFMKHVIELIKKTSILSEPENRLQEIVRDADLHYLGIPEYLSLAEDLRKEWEQTIEKYYDEKEWLEQNMRFMLKHTFYTPEARSHYQHGKEQNMALLRRELAHL